MISANDTTILATLSRYPDMPAREADEYIARIEHEENVPICHAVLGRIDKTELADNARETFDEFQRWSTDRTRRVRNEQLTARRRQQETRTALTMTRLHQQGLISDQIMLMYGISGDLPERNMYMTLTPEEKEALWADRLESRFGPNWRERFQERDVPLPLFRRRRLLEAVDLINWKREGF